ncbi:acetyl-coenzyme A synthetase [Legionella geestiana]|uniref:Acetate--CoA ligase n=1 Tax=Legionella geestiana TaxID=45065 RepID=A0A0W0TP02_9GAMM|nr:acetate--CoA ligase [Legionella geestiana]KTC97327.1 acetyl-coenzyme A synthetase [Legionella geestiana]STX55105.1 acetyl-CoA synthetase [Legionella geestiana]
MTTQTTEPRHPHEAFWKDVALRTVDWMEPFTSVCEGSLAEGNTRWFGGGRLNVSVNCIDRHLPHKARQTAIIWEGDTPDACRTLTFAELHDEVCRMANVLSGMGLKRGSRVAIYLPTIPEAAIAMLACARAGFVHTVVFAGFSAAALRERLKAAECDVLITGDSFHRGGRLHPLKSEADLAAQGLPVRMLVIRHSHEPVPFDEQRDVWWHTARTGASIHFAPEPMQAEDPLFILYTSGSTGTPKGLVHTTGGYLVQVAFSHQYVFGCSPHEVFWSTADVGWITGHSYTVYGPLCNGITTLLFSGIPLWPQPSRCWEMIDRHRVSVFYTAPTAIRSLMRAGDEWLDTSSRDTLRLLGSVGEPINPAAWQWYYDKVGRGRCPIVDTWWQTETGAIMLCPPANVAHAKPGSARSPLPGIEPLLLNDNNAPLKGAGEGRLTIRVSWPAMARTILGNHERYRQSYLATGYYLTGDGARVDADGDYWITGRTDDMLNVSGHLLGCAEIESALVAVEGVAEAAVIGVAHPVRGEAVHAFVTLKEGIAASAALRESLLSGVKERIGAIAKPETIEWAGDLPKTRSGKIMRRILRKIANHEAQSVDDLGDLSTLANPQSVLQLLNARNNLP